MNQERLERGIKKLNEVAGDVGKVVIESLADIAPDLATYILEFAFGDIYCRDTLSLKQREMITITSLLTAGGCEPQLEIHIQGGLNVGLSKQKIIESMIQCTPMLVSLEY